MKEFDTLLHRAFRELEARGISRWEYDPPLYRVLRRVGLSLKPPLFQSFRANALLQGCSYAVSFGLFGWFALYSNRGLSSVIWCILALVAGCVFGVATALNIERRKRHLQLPAWCEREG